MTTIQDIRATDDPQRSYEWEVEVLGNAATGQLSLITARAQNFTVPSKDHDTIEINYKSRKTRHAGRDASPGTFTVQFWDDEAQEVYNFFDSWIENGLSNSIVGGGLTKDLYGVDVILRLLAHDSTTTTGQFRFQKVWPSSLGDITFDYSNSDHMTFTVTFTYDVQLKEE